MKKLFISRELSPDSPVKAFAERQNLELTATSLIEFSAVPFATLAETDWIFFYSKRGVHFFFRQLQNLQLKTTAQLATMGTGTYRALKTFGKTADFAGNGQPETVAEAFGILAAGKKSAVPTSPTL